MGALPNSFESVIEGALGKREATAEIVAAAIAASDPFLRAIRSGMKCDNEDLEVRAKTVRSKLSKAFSAPTANQMFDE